jgi:Domain of unknown function (DUF4407)
MGALVCLTATFAFMSAAYAFFTVFELIPVAVGFGVLWAILILNMDRLILMTFPKTDAWWRRVVHAIPRAVLAIFIGITIAHPVTLRLFEPEILDRVAKEREVERSETLRQGDLARKRVNDEADTLKRALPQFVHAGQRRKERDESAAALSGCDIKQAQQEKDYLCEADGTCGTRKPLCREVCEEKKAAYKRTVLECEARRHEALRAGGALAHAEQELSQAVKDIDAATRARIEVAEGQSKSALQRLATSAKISFLIRSDALGQLADERPKVAQVRWFVAAFFVLVEITAVFMAIITPADSADRLAVALRNAFAGRIPTLAQQLDGAEASFTPPRSEPSREEPRRESDEHPRGFGGRIAAAVILSVLITGGMLYFGAKIEEASAAGTFFATMAPLVVHYRGSRRR